MSSVELRSRWMIFRATWRSDGSRTHFSTRGPCGMAEWSEIVNQTNCAGVFCLMSCQNQEACSLSCVVNFVLEKNEVAVLGFFMT